MAVCMLPVCSKKKYIKKRFWKSCLKKKSLWNLEHLNHFSLFYEKQGFTLLFEIVHSCLVNDPCYCPFCCTGAIVEERHFMRDIKRGTAGND